MPRNAPAGLSIIDIAMIWSRIGLVITVWLSAGLFGLYILAFYVGALTDGDVAAWNQVLPGLYAPNRALATTGIGVHFVAGGVILALGSIQLISGIRERRPWLHRWIGRVYVTASFLAGAGGLAFILVNGTIGGTVMNVGFSLYGVLTMICAVQTFRYARAREFDVHRAWALRLFALAIGSWLYRMDYGFWHLLTHAAGHQHDFRGPFDHVMAFFFYIPNLIVAEVMIRSTRPQASGAQRAAAVGVLVAAMGFLLLGTYYFTKLYWGPAILHRLQG